MTATRELLNKWASVQAMLSDGLLLIEPFVVDAVRGVVASAIVERRMKSASDYEACPGDELERWAPLLERIEIRSGRRIEVERCVGWHQACRRRDSNPRHADYDSAALTD
jgi:hypothetical protein